MATALTDLPGTRGSRHLRIVSDTAGTPVEAYPSAAKLIKRVVRCHNPECLMPDLPARLGVRTSIAIVWKSGRFDPLLSHTTSVHEQNGRTHVEYVCKLCNTPGAWDI